MALVPNTTSVFSTSPAPNARPANVATRVSSEPTSEIDALDLTTDVSFDAATSGFAAEDEQARLLTDDRGGRGAFSDPGFNRLFTSNSESFAAILEEPTRGDNDTDTQVSARSGTPVGKIINTYETNALIITGEQPIRGTSLSFSL